jgi:hypothetical protein
MAGVASAGRKARVLFIGPFPPPVHGQSVATKGLFDVLVAHGLAVKACDTGEGGSGAGGKLRRLARLGAAAASALLVPARHLYVSVNSRGGMAVTVLLCLLGRLTGKRLTLHHHVYRYVAQYDPMMALLAHVAGPKALHIANCAAMAEELAGRYPAIGHASGYGNVNFVDPALRSLPLSTGDGPIVLGHMSNLTEAKGLGRSIAILAAAREAGLETSLLVAGPCSEPGAEETLAEAARRFGPAIEYMGPVYGERKLDFFRRSDVFVFPTRYVNEAGPIVNLEALAAGAPVISTAQCCIPSTLAESGGIAIPASEDPCPAALAFLSRFKAAPRERAQAARERFDVLVEEQRALEAELIARFAG